MDVLDIKEVKPRKRAVKHSLALKKSLSVSQLHNQKISAVQLFDSSHISDFFNMSAFNLNVHNLDVDWHSQDELSHPTSAACTKCTAHILHTENYTLNHAGAMSNPADNLVFNSDSSVANTSSNFSNSATFFNASNLRYNIDDLTDTTHHLYQTESVDARPKSTVKTVVSLDLSSSLDSDASDLNKKTSARALAASDVLDETKTVKTRTTRKRTVSKIEQTELASIESSEDITVKPEAKRTRTKTVAEAVDGENTEIKVVKASKSPVRRSRKIVFEASEASAPEDSALEVKPPVKTIRRRAVSKLKTETTADLQQSAESKAEFESELTKGSDSKSVFEGQAESKKILRLLKKSKPSTDSEVDSQLGTLTAAKDEVVGESMSALAGTSSFASSNMSAHSSADSLSTTSSALTPDLLSDEGARLKAAAAQLDAAMRKVQSQTQNSNFPNTVRSQSSFKPEAAFNQSYVRNLQSVDGFGGPAQANNNFDDFGKFARPSYRPRNIGRKGRVPSGGKRQAKEFDSISDLFKHIDVHEKKEVALDKKVKPTQESKYVPVESSVAEDLMKENGISLLQAAAMAVYQDGNPASRQDIKKQIDADRQAEKSAQQAKEQAQRRAADIISNVKSLLASKNSNAGTYASQSTSSANQAAARSSANLGATSSTVDGSSFGNDSVEQSIEGGNASARGATSVSSNTATSVSGRAASGGKHAQTAFSRMHLNEPASRTTNVFTSSVMAASKNIEDALSPNPSTSLSAGTDTAFRLPVNPLSYKFPNDPAKQSKFDALSQSLSKALSSNSEEFAPSSTSGSAARTSSLQTTANAALQNAAHRTNPRNNQGSGYPFPERSSLFEQLSKLAKKASLLDAKSGTQLNSSSDVDEPQDSVFNSERYAQASAIDNIYAAESDLVLLQPNAASQLALSSQSSISSKSTDYYEQDNAGYESEVDYDSESAYAYETIYDSEYEDDSRFNSSQHDEAEDKVRDGDSWIDVRNTWSDNNAHRPQDSESWFKEETAYKVAYDKPAQSQSEIEAEEAQAWLDYAQSENRDDSAQNYAALAQDKSASSTDTQNNVQEELSPSKQRMQRLAKIVMSKKALLKPEDQKPMSNAQLAAFARQEHIKLETNSNSYNAATNRAHSGYSVNLRAKGDDSFVSAFANNNARSTEEIPYIKSAESMRAHAAFASKQAVAEQPPLVPAMTVVGVDTWKDEMICCLDRTNPDRTVFQTSKLFVVSDTGLNEFKEWVESNQVSTIIFSTHGQDFYQKVQSFCQNHLSQVVLEVAPWNDTSGKKIEAKASFRLAQDCAIAKRLEISKRDAGVDSQKERLDLQKKARSLFQTRNEKFKLRRAIDTILNRSRLEITSHFEDYFAPEFMDLLIHAYELKDDDYALEDYIYELYETDESVDQDVIYHALHDDLANHQEQIADLCEQFKTYTQVLDKVEQESINLAMDFSDEYLENYENLLTIPAISSFAAVMILGEIGCNTQIVSTARQLESQVLYPERSQFNEYLHDVFLGCARRVAEDKHNRLYPLFMISINNMPPEQALMNVAKKLVYSVFGVIKYHCDFTDYQQEFKKFIE